MEISSAVWAAASCPPSHRSKHFMLRILFESQPTMIKVYSLKDFRELGTIYAVPFTHPFRGACKLYYDYSYDQLQNSSFWPPL